MLPMGVHRRLQELPRAHARQLNRILERQKYAFAGARLRVHLQQILPLVDHFAGGNGVLRPARQHIRKRTFAGAVRPHNRMHLADVHGEAYALQNLGVVDGDLQVAYVQQGGVVVHCVSHLFAVVSLSVAFHSMAFHRHFSGVSALWVVRCRRVALMDCAYGLPSRVLYNGRAFTWLRRGGFAGGGIFARMLTYCRTSSMARRTAALFL